MEGVELGWLAGILDGEGSVGFVKSKVHPYVGNDGVIIEKTFDVFPYVNVSNTSLELLNKFRDLCIKLLTEMISGNIKVAKISCVLSENKRHRNAYRFTLNRPEHIKIFLIKVLPHLTAKKNDAVYLLNFLDIKKEYYLKRYNFYKQWQEAKRTGILQGRKTSRNKVNYSCKKKSLS